MVRFSESVLFRYQVVSEVLAQLRSGSSRAQAVRCVAQITHVDPSDTDHVVSKRTIYRWLSAFQANGLLGLEEKTRLPVEGSQALSQDFLDFLTREKCVDPRASIPEIIRRARQIGLLDKKTKIDRSTVYRVARRLGGIARLLRVRISLRDFLIASPRKTRFLSAASERHQCQSIPDHSFYLHDSKTWT